jgi:hypothetical protein
MPTPFIYSIWIQYTYVLLLVLLKTKLYVYTTASWTVADFANDLKEFQSRKV